MEQNKTAYDREPEFVSKKAVRFKKQFTKYTAIFGVIIGCILFYFAIKRIGVISDTFAKIYDILKPIIYGFIIAYLLNPIVNKMENLISKLGDKWRKVGRVAGIFVALLALLALVGALVNMVIPQLALSVQKMVLLATQKLQELQLLLQDDTALDATVRGLLSEGSIMLENWLKTDLVNQTTTLMVGVTGGVISVVMEFMDIIVGVLISVYLLYGKDTFVQQAKKCTYALLRPERANMVLHIGNKANQMFSGFIIGKIIDSAIMGVLCYIGLLIFRITDSYALLVSVIVGVTNVIPFFGPFIGAIPSAFIVMLEEPIKGIYFLIFVFVLQQLDGNVIGPKILGESTGLPSFWVIFAILLGGGLFGVPGMIVGVPTFALIYYIIDLYLNQKLKKKHLPTDSSNYHSKSYVDNEGCFVDGKSEAIEETKEKEEE